MLENLNMSKVDSRTLKTKAALRKALIICMKEKPLKEIQVKEICQYADLDRTTFYRHYKGIGDLLAELEEEQLEHFRSLMASNDCFGEKLIFDILDLIEENKQINAATGEHILSDSLVRKMADTAYEYSIEAWKSKLPKATEQEVALCLKIMISASLQVLVHDGEQFDRDTVARYLSKMITGCVKLYE